MFTVGERERETKRGREREAESRKVSANVAYFKYQVNRYGL